jgi:hypothetical protein
MGAASMVLLGAVRVDFDAVLMCFLSLSFYSFCGVEEENKF